MPLSAGMRFCSQSCILGLTAYSFAALHTDPASVALMHHAVERRPSLDGPSRTKPPKSHTAYLVWADVGPRRRFVGHSLQDDAAAGLCLPRDGTRQAAHRKRAARAHLRLADRAHVGRGTTGATAASARVWTPCFPCSALRARQPGPLVPEARRRKTVLPELYYFSFRPPPPRFTS